MSVLDRPHIKQGRTFRQAVDAGNYYRLEHLSAGSRLMVEYWQATSAEETIELELAQERPRVTAGMTFVVYRVMPASVIGCMRLEKVGTYTVPGDEEG